jgi:asparagine synthase (glutamine-hydrolysing)
LRSDVKVGSCLSGGIDSSSIVCLANRLLRQEKAQDRQETVSSCFDIREYDEQAYINEVIQKTGVIPHRVYPRVDDLLNYLDRIIWHQDEPFVSTSIFAQWEVFKRAAENNITVMLDGQGADELLGGYHIFYGKFLARLIMSQKWARLITEVKHINQLHGYKPSQTARMLTGNLPPVFLRKFFRQLFPNELSSTINRNGITREFEPWQKPTRTMLEESLAEIRFTHLPILLHYEDRNSMAHSIESRLPFLDYRLVEFVLGLPDRYKIYEAVTKYILRQSLKDLVPESIINRSDKMGFVTPEEIWLKRNSDIFRNELEETIKLSNGLINDKILDFFDAIIHNKRHFDFTSWRYIAFGRWLKRYNVSVKL